MSDECERIERLLDETESPALPADLAAHAQSCEVCRLRLDIARDLRGRLGSGAGLEASRRAALVDRIVRAKGSARAHPLLRRRVWIAAAGLAAAVVVAAVLLRSKPEPILPTDLVGDLLGPLAEAAPAGADPAVSPRGESSALSDALGVFLGDLEDPIRLARSALEAPKTTLPERAAAEGAEKP